MFFRIAHKALASERKKGGDEDKDTLLMISNEGEIEQANIVQQDSNNNPNTFHQIPLYANIGISLFFKLLKLSNFNRNNKMLKRVVNTVGCILEVFWCIYLKNSISLSLCSYLILI